MKLRRLLLPALLPLLALTACGDDVDDVDPVAATSDPVATTEVAVVDNDFEPAAITVDAGTTVTWTWEGSNPHDVSGDGFASAIRTSGHLEHTFDEPGQFAYRCTVHPGMRGRVVVR